MEPPRLPHKYGSASEPPAFENHRVHGLSLHLEDAAMLGGYRNSNRLASGMSPLPQ